MLKSTVIVESKVPLKETSPLRSTWFGQWFEHTFLRFGSGHVVFKPIVSAGWWNRASWILIVMGVVGWAIGLWLLRGYSDSP